jgi:hypothetical protein
MAGRVEIPPEHTALKALEQTFRAAGEEKERLRRLERRRTRRRAMLATVAAIVAASGTAAIATKVFDSNGPPSRAVDEGEVARVPADRRPALATAADPVDQYGWGVRIYQARAGKTCALAGRLLHGRLGAAQNGQFHEFAADVPGQCGDLAASHALVAVRNYGSAATAGATRTVVYGIVDRTVKGIGIGRTAPGRQIPIADDGTFVYAVQGVRTLAGQRAFVAGAGGVRSLPLGLR